MSVVAYNKLSDIVAAFTQSATGDTGAIADYTSGSPVTLNFDSIEITDTTETTNNKGGQDRVAVNRISGEDWTVEFTAKYGSGAPIPIKNKQGRLKITGGGAEDCKGIVTDVKKSYNDTSTYTVTLKAYGVAIG